MTIKYYLETWTIIGMSTSIQFWQTIPFITKLYASFLGPSSMTTFVSGWVGLMNPPLRKVSWIGRRTASCWENFEDVGEKLRPSQNLFSWRLTTCPRPLVEPSSTNYRSSLKERVKAPFSCMFLLAIDRLWNWVTISSSASTKEKDDRWLTTKASSPHNVTSFPFITNLSL